MAGNISDGNGAGRVAADRFTNSFGSVTQLSGTNTYSGGTSHQYHAAGDQQPSVGTGTVTLDNALFQADGFSNLTFTNNFKINNTRHRQRDRRQRHHADHCRQYQRRQRCRAS